MKYLLGLIMLALLCSCNAEGYAEIITSPTPAMYATPMPTLIPTPNTAFHIDGVPVEDVILYFNEVCLDAEYVNSGNPHRVQKWEVPIQYRLYGSVEDEDREVINDFASYLNTIEGFPGMYEAGEQEQANLNIHFTDEDTMLYLMGDGFYGNDGGVTFWYDNDKIYDEIICVRTDLDRELRSSVLLEELYNGLGPVQDTELRADSIIYSRFSCTQQISDMDRLIVSLLYHPDIKCGMDASACEQIIRKLFS